MAYPHNIRARVSVNHPEPTGICRRCGFYYPLSQLVDQPEWVGANLQTVLTRVCIRTCVDRPNETLRTLVIGPDSVPPKDASPTFYTQQNQGGQPGVDGVDLLHLLPLGD